MTKFESKYQRAQDDKKMSRVRDRTQVLQPYLMQPVPGPRCQDENKKWVINMLR